MAKVTSLALPGRAVSEVAGIFCDRDDSYCSVAGVADVVFSVIVL
jgi:hypothetical protein